MITVYGLAASIWTQNLSLAHRLAKRIEAGTVWVNCHHLIDPALPFRRFQAERHRTRTGGRRNRVVHGNKISLDANLS
jgi:phenylacetaldehyde dehydrogenase